MQQESVRNEKDIRITNNQGEIAFTCGENNFITRKRLNNYAMIMEYGIWLHPV